MVYNISSEKVQLVDEKNRTVYGDTGEPFDGWMLPVEKNKRYYIQLPDVIIDTEYEVYAYIYPNPVKKLENGKVYAVEGKGKYAYYPFVIKGKSLAGLYVNAMFFDNEKMYFKMQKKINGKWKDITSIRTKMAYPGQYGETAPYGLSKGTYRLGIKIEKDQIASIKVDIRRVKYKNSIKKSKAVQLKKGKGKEGIFTWNDKNAHWYKVVKSKRNKVKTLTVYAGCAVDKIDLPFTRKECRNP